ncbi:MAG: hypothetical protein ABIY70_08595, partial [Capsulimonas sp.]
LETVGSNVVVNQVDEGTANYTTAPITKWMSCTADGEFSRGWWGGNGATYVTGPMGGQPVGPSQPNTPATHTDGANYVAADGHVKYLKPTQVSGGWQAYSTTAPQNTHESAGTDSMVISGTTKAQMTMSPF